MAKKLYRDWELASLATKRPLSQKYPNSDFYRRLRIRVNQGVTFDYELQELCFLDFIEVIVSQFDCLKIQVGVGPFFGSSSI
jgi:hypothetical protein